MIKKIMYWFALTEGGARGVIRASVGCFFMYLAYMLPMLLLSYFVRGVVLNAVQGPVVYLVWMLLIAGIMYVFINFSYITTYNETYKESKNIRVHIAETLKRLPLSFFSKHDISDLSQTILQDVADMEHALGHAIPEAFGFGVFLVFISILLLGGNFILGLTIVVPVLLSLFMAMLTKRQQLLALEKFYHKKRETAEAFQESIELQQEIRSYGQKEAVKEKLCALLDEQEKEQLATEKAQVLPFSAITSLVKFSLGLTVLVGSMLFVRGEINIPYFVLYITASARIIDGLTGLYMNLAELLYIDTKSRRLRDLYNTPSPSLDPCLARITD